MTPTEAEVEAFARKLAAEAGWGRYVDTARRTLEALPTDAPVTDTLPAEAIEACPFCGGTDIIVHSRDVEPQGDPYYGEKMETIVECSCGATLFDRYFHEGFSGKAEAIAAWNRRAALPHIRGAEAAGHSVTVKPLVWEAVNPNSLRATAIGLRYYAYANPFLPDGTPWSGYSEGYLPVQLGCFATADEAKAAAQADYEARILSAIAPSPTYLRPAPSDMEEIVEALRMAREHLAYRNAAFHNAMIRAALDKIDAALRKMGAGR